MNSREQEPVADIGDDPERLLDLEEVDANLFRGITLDRSFGRIFGGQVVAQALTAACRTVEARRCHSLHCYFLRQGNPSRPVLYSVDRARDGGNFSARRVTATQGGVQIFNMAASFQSPQAGPTHQVAAPEAPPPEQCLDFKEFVRRSRAELSNEALYAYMLDRRFDVRPVDPPPLLPSGALAPLQRTWFRYVQPVSTHQTLHQGLLAYFSDLALLSTTIRPHNISETDQRLQLASLDHALWFIRDCNINDWHLYVQESPAAFGGRGLCFGNIFNAGGELVAAVAQEGLIRIREPAK